METSWAIKSLNVSEPRKLHINGRELYTGFLKEPKEEAVFLNQLNFNGDGQAEDVHGGLDKAVCVYSLDHYTYWTATYGKVFEASAFGENLTVSGAQEVDVHIGDIFQVGEAVVQITQPRQPCHKIAEIHQFKDFVAKVSETGFSGYYLRVLEQGYVKKGDQFKLMEADQGKVSVAFVNQIKYHDRQNKEAIKKILDVEALAESLRHSFNDL